MTINVEMAKTRILILEADEEVRRELRLRLQRTDAFEIRHPHVLSIEFIVAVARRFEPDITVMDWGKFCPMLWLEMKGLSGQVWIYDLVGDKISDNAQVFDRSTVSVSQLVGKLVHFKKQPAVEVFTI